MNRQRTQLSVRLQHPTRDLSRVCDVLGLKPKRIWKKGDERTTPKGTKLGGVYESSFCYFDVGRVSREPLPKQIDTALKLLEPHRSTLRRLNSSGGKISFFVGWFLDDSIMGEEFDARLLERMARLRIALDLSIYVPDQPRSRVTRRRSRKR